MELPNVVVFQTSHHIKDNSGDVGFATYIYRTIVTYILQVARGMVYVFTSLRNEGVITHQYILYCIGHMLGCRTRWMDSSVIASYECYLLQIGKNWPIVIDSLCHHQ